MHPIKVPVSSHPKKEPRLLLLTNPPHFEDTLYWMSCTFMCVFITFFLGGSWNYGLWARCLTLAMKLFSLWNIVLGPNDNLVFSSILIFILGSNTSSQAWGWGGGVNWMRDINVWRSDGPWVSAGHVYPRDCRCTVKAVNRPRDTNVWRVCGNFSSVNPSSLFFLILCSWHHKYLETLLFSSLVVELIPYLRSFQQL